MTYIVNLSATHSYSIESTISAFVDLCNEHNYYGSGPLAYMQRTINYLWVMAAYQKNSKKLIEPYKLGKMSTTEFLKELAKVFYFIQPLDEETRHKKLADAWNSSIKASPQTKQKFDVILEKAKQEKVYLVSNSNELNIQAILTMLQKLYPTHDFSKIDVSIKKDQKPVEIFPNVYLCLSYRYEVFKTPTAGLIQLLAEQIDAPITLVSQYGKDLEKGNDLQLAEVIPANKFYAKQQLEAYIAQREQGKEYYFTRQLLSIFNLANQSYSASVKISAAKKLLTHWDDATTLKEQLTESEILALREGQLGKLFKQHPECDVLLETNVRYQNV